MKTREQIVLFNPKTDQAGVDTEKIKEGVGAKADACSQFSSFTLAAGRLDIDTGPKQRRQWKKSTPALPRFLHYLPLLMAHLLARRSDMPVIRMELLETPRHYFTTLLYLQ